VLALVGHHEKFGISEDDAIAQAFRLIVEKNPFPATTGRICPHRCESGCNRHQKDGGVAVGAIERYIGDIGLERGWSLPVMLASTSRVQKVAIIGAGPAGLSCAYQLIRRGYSSTIFESMPEPGGMLRYGIPPYRLPAKILRGEIDRILNLGVELRTNTTIGKDVSLDELRRDYQAIFIAPGAGASRSIEIPGSEGSHVYQAIGFLRDVARGNPPPTGKNVVVLGGGNTATDVARVCVRILGADAKVTLIRRRNETIDHEIEEAIEEGVQVELRTTLNSVIRNEEGNVVRVIAQRVTLGDKDERGYRKMIPIPGEDFEIPCDSVVLALGQKPDVRSLTSNREMNLETERNFRTHTDGIWRGGDAVAPSFAAVVIAQGRQVALSIDAELSGVEIAEPVKLNDVASSRIKLDCFEAYPRLPRQVTSPSVRVTELTREVELGHSGAEIRNEAKRCLSCGSCSGCERCWMFCTPGCMKRVPQAAPGEHFSIELEKCDGCKKCVDECPCGILEMT
jgi:NADPH-dependent glutamate synthase beta subunit-like oxidoreductase